MNFFSVLYNTIRFVNVLLKNFTYVKQKTKLYPLPKEQKQYQIFIEVHKTILLVTFRSQFSSYKKKLKFILSCEFLYNIF